MLEIHAKSVEETQEIGKRLGERLEPGDFINLVGELGAGKTTFTQGLARGLSSTEYVTSPTFTLINEYTGRIPLYHFDVYRLGDVSEMEDLGYDEYFSGDGATVIEWGDRVEEVLPEERLDVFLEYEDDNRKITLVPHGRRYEELIAELNNASIGN